MKHSADHRGAERPTDEELAARPIVEAEPAEAVAVVGDRLPLLRIFADALGERGERLGLLGPQEGPRLWTRHLLNCALMAPCIVPGARIADVGSGAGLPGIVLAIARPDARVILIEPMERRCAWLNEQVAALGLENARVERGRAEEFHGRIQVDQVTARAVTALKGLIPMTAPLLRDGGELLFLKGSSVEREIEAARGSIRAHRIVDVRVEELGAGVLPEITRVFRGRTAGSAHA